MVAGGLLFGLAIYLFVAAVSERVVGDMGGLGDVRPEPVLVYPRL